MVLITVGTVTFTSRAQDQDEEYDSRRVNALQIEHALAGYDYTTLLPDDKAVLDKTLEIVRNSGYLLADEITTGLENESIWKNSPDELVLSQWISAAFWALSELDSDDWQSAYRVAAVGMRYYCKTTGTPMPGADIAQLNAFFRKVGKPVGYDSDDEDDSMAYLNQMAMNITGGLYADFALMAACHYCYNADWGDSRNDIYNMADKWFSMTDSYQQFYIACVIEGSMGPLLLSGEKSAFYDNWLDDLDRTHQLLNGKVPSMNSTDEAFVNVPDDMLFEFMLNVADVDDEFMPGAAENPEQRLASVDEFRKAWIEWLDARAVVAKGMSDTTRNDFEELTNVMRNNIISVITEED